MPKRCLCRESKMERPLPIVHDVLTKDHAVGDPVRFRARPKFSRVEFTSTEANLN